MTQREKQILDIIRANPMISQQELADTLQITRSSVAVHISNLLKKGYIVGKGYVLGSGSYAAVVGGVNVDIGGRSFRALRPADSNPGSVSISLGGVGRNIAHNMALLGVQTRLLTAWGEDANGKLFSDSCAELGIDITHGLKVPGAATSTYLYIADEQGEMALALSDMSICEHITPEYLAKQLPVLQNAQVVVMDANLPEESIRFLAENCKAPIFCDPVSVTKANKLAQVLDKIHTLKPNRLEAEFLTGISITDKASAQKAAQALLAKGVKRVFLSMGSDGVLAAQGDQVLWQGNLPGKMVNTTGCGDAFTAALVWAYLQEADLQKTTLAGLAAASVAMESSTTINPGMSEDALKERMNINL